MNNDRLQRLTAMRDELSALIEQAQKPADEWPKMGDEVWYTTTIGVEKGRWNAAGWCESAFVRGLVFRTQAAAERADQRRIVEALEPSK